MKLKSDEEFKEFPYNTLLEVSQYGNVRKKDGEILEQKEFKHYSIVKNPTEGGKVEFVHRLVALTWLKDAYKKGMIVHHIDGDKLNNTAENLTWEKGCVHAGLFHGTEVSCEGCPETECEFRNSFITYIWK